jgi:thiol-disulfide isomerase/thioredoxin
MSSDPFSAPRVVRAPDFPAGLDWLHAEGGAPALADLRGRVALLDFWTFGCINCLHVLPQVRELERRFPRELAVVGVHSGKFIAERETPRIARACERLGVAHPVLNDRQFRAWRAWAVRAWPTIALIDPRGYVVGVQAGELTADRLAPVIAQLIAAGDADGTLVRGAPHVAASPARADDALRFPGKVAVSPPDARGVRRLAIADTGRHRVIVGRLDARGTTLTVTHVVGRGVATSALDGPTASGATRDSLAARADGPADRATFDGPQGLAFGEGAHADTLFVADAGNHALRAIDLATGAVRTLAGTGARLRTAADRAAGAMASPWDVVHTTVDGRATLFVAMAGTHQLWIVDPATGAAGAHAGGRGEDVVDGPLMDALLAQPMGLATDGRTLWFADAESSAIRAADTHPNGAVRTLVGTGLFDFGDVDGEGDAVRLQHPQAVARAPDGRLLIADGYNDALKWLDPATRRVTTWRTGYHEPTGLAIADGRAWVADTGAHRIVAIDLATGAEDALRIVG